MKRFLAGAAVAATLSACGISQQQEQQMGMEYAAQINAQLPIVQDAEINRYINVLGDSIAKLTDRADLDWTFYVVDAMEVNAFAVPGGHIYMNRGLIQRTQNLSQVAGVLGHEIGHVVRRHSVKQMEKMQGAQVGMGLACALTSVCNNQVGQLAVNAGGQALFAKFSRDDEREADEEAVRHVVRAGINPQGIPEMFRILLEERETRRSGVDAWFATHPLEEERVKNTEGNIAKLDPAITRSLTRDSQSFQNFKRRLASLPPSPAPRQPAGR